MVNSPQWGQIWNFAGGDFFTEWWEPEEEWFWLFELVSKLKTALGYSTKNPNRGHWGYTFLKSPPGNFRFVTLSQEILERKSFFYPWKFCKFVWHSLEIPKSKTKTHGNSALIFLEHPWNFHFFFNWPLEFPHVFSSRPPEIPCPQPSCLDFFRNSPFCEY